MITGLKAEIKLIDDGKYLVVVKGSNTDGDKQGNSGAVCKNFDKAMVLAIERLNEVAKMLEEQTGTLPGMDEEGPE